MGGASLHMTGALLSHRQAATTARYAHLADAPQQAAAARVAGAVAGAMKTDPVPLLLVAIRSRVPRNG
jgi:hypothetical protein